MKRKYERRLEIAQLREEGRRAALAGRHIQTNPYRYMNGVHWISGHLRGQEELAEARRENNPEGEDL